MSNNRFISRAQRVGVRPNPFEQEELTLFASAFVNGGMDNESDPADIENNKLTLAVNARARESVTFRRAGATGITPVAPDSLPIIFYGGYKAPDEQVSLYRITSNSIYRQGTSSWTVLTGGALTMTQNTHIQWIVAGTFVGFGNGVNALQQINVAADTYAVAGNAPAYKYFCTINGRIVGFNFYDAVAPSPILLGWSGYYNLTQWDSSVDPSAGELPLLTSPSSFADPGTGVFAFGDNLLAVREHSLWIGTVQPSATDPFYFYNKVPTMGCDTPKSIQQIPGGIVYYDRRLRNVFAFTLDMSQPVPIGDEVRDTLRNMITDPELVFSGYDSAYDEYHLCVPIGSSAVVRRWVFNFKTKAWTYDTVNNLTFINGLDVASASITIDDLTGTIDGLIGTIDSLSPAVESSVLFTGYAGGVISEEDYNNDTDDGTQALYNGIYYHNGSISYGETEDFQMDLRSKLFQLDTKAAYIAQLQIVYRPLYAGGFAVEYSKDGGVTFYSYKDVTFTSDEAGKRLKLTCMKNVRGDNYMWRITGEAGCCEIVEYKAYVFDNAGYQRQRTA